MDILQQLKYEDGITIGEALNVSVTGFVVVLLILALLAVLVLLLSKAVRAVENKTKKKASPTPKSEQTESAPATPRKVITLRAQLSSETVFLYIPTATSCGI